MSYGNGDDVPRSALGRVSKHDELYKLMFAALFLLIGLTVHEWFLRVCCGGIAGALVRSFVVVRRRERLRRVKQRLLGLR